MQPYKRLSKGTLTLLAVGVMSVGGVLGGSEAFASTSSQARGATSTQDYGKMSRPSHNICATDAKATYNQSVAKTKADYKTLSTQAKADLILAEKSAKSAGEKLQASRAYKTSLKTAAKIRKEAQMQAKIVWQDAKTKCAKAQ